MPTPFPADWQALLQHEPFAAMAAEQLALLAGQARRQHYPRGASLTSPQAGPASQLFIVLEGQVLAEDIYSGQAFALLGQGEMFPLGALLAQRPVTNHYRADSDCMVLQLPQSAFVALCQQSAAFQLFCTQRLANLLSRARQLHPAALGGQGLRPAHPACRGNPAAGCLLPAGNHAAPLAATDATGRGGLGGHHQSRAAPAGPVHPARPAGRPSGRTC
ncbi:Crp/Fnr family transcriptional regulator [Aquitalea magnusonii]|uniref:Crp/Fnr family transcriptional regulator n=1 Tax=Aquitalea magnusonii TaxID=332411 RepID=UPI000750076F|nr:Crp/Fnr family transcriptional regulator [Aquitalea magnusonii]